MLDAVKGIACAVIVGHHLSRYGPMPEVAFPLAPGLFDWLAHSGRLAVQVFLVIGGFLAGASLTPGGRVDVQRPLARIARRYQRLVMPYLAALTLSVAVAALVRPWLAGDVVPAAPGMVQLLAHGLLLQDLLGQDALSAGIWYVAIDFQLFVLALVLLGLPELMQRRGWAGPRRARALCGVLVVALVGTSLWVFNRYPELDDTALYFFGAYGLGMLAFWIGRIGHPGHWLAGVALLAGLGAVALGVEWRSRIATALVTALALVLLQRRHALAPAVWPMPGAPLRRLGCISYSLFLVHFPVILWVSGIVSHWLPARPWIDALGMLVAFGLSLAVAALLHRWVEMRPASWRAVLVLFAVLMFVGILVSL